MAMECGFRHNLPITGNIIIEGGATQGGSLVAGCPLSVFRPVVLARGGRICQQVPCRPQHPTPGFGGGRCSARRLVTTACGPAPYATRSLIVGLRRTGISMQFASLSSRASHMSYSTPGQGCGHLTRSTFSSC